jgi:hypothetical protein
MLQSDGAVLAEERLDGDRIRSRKVVVVVVVVIVLINVRWGRAKAMT